MPRLSACLFVCMAALSQGSDVLQLKPGGREWRVLPEKTAHVYPFQLDTGQFMRLEILQRDLDVVTQVKDPAGKTVLSVDALNGLNGPEDVPFLASRPGRYEVRVESGSKRGDRSTYRMRLLALRHPNPEDRARAAAARAFFEAEGLREAGAPLRQTEARYLDALRQAQGVKDLVRMADSWFHVGRIRAQGDGVTETRKAYTEALGLYQKLGNRHQEAVVLNNLGTAFDLMEDAETALGFFRSASDLSHALGYRRVELDSLRNLGRVEFQMGEVGEALDHLERAAALAEKPVDQAKVMNLRGSVLARMGEVDKAFALHSEALEIFKSAGISEEVARTLTHLGDAYREAGKTQLAVSFYEKALVMPDIPPTDQATALNNMGVAYYDAELYDKALGAYEKALKLYSDRGHRPSQAIALSNLGFVQNARREPEKAAEFFERALPIAQDLGRRPAEAATYFGMAWAARLRNSPREAERLAREALRLIEELRTKAERRELQMQFLAKSQDYYQLLVDLLMDQNEIQPGAGYDRQAFEVSERSRARSLLDTIRENGFDVPVLTLQQIQREVLDEETVLLSLDFGKSRTYGWVVTKTAAEDFRLPPKQEIKALADQVYKLYLESHESEDREKAAQMALLLSRKLFGPLGGRLAGKRLLFVVPPDLQRLPFESLPDPSAPVSSRGSWPEPLLARHEIVMAPSASILAALRQMAAGRKAPEGLLALIGDPVYQPGDDRLRLALRGRTPPPIRPGFSFERLLYAEDEWKRIRDTVQGSSERILILTGLDATKTRLLEPSRKSERLGAYRYIHFGVHGDVNERAPELSALVLSRFDPQGLLQDPFLRVEEIEKLDLSADLVVLSACRTGLGKKVAGEGLVGLTQGFFAAGASSVIVSLWDVDDLSTSELMSRFYRNLLRKKMSPSRALREAQLSMWRDERWNAPYHWGGFSQIGEWREPR